MHVVALNIHHVGNLAELTMSLMPHERLTHLTRHHHALASESTVVEVVGLVEHALLIP